MNSYPVRSSFNARNALLNASAGIKDNRQMCCGESAASYLTAKTSPCCRLSKQDGRPGMQVAEVFRCCKMREVGIDDKPSPALHERSFRESEALSRRFPQTRFQLFMPVPGDDISLACLMDGRITCTGILPSHGAEAPCLCGSG